MDKTPSSVLDAALVEACPRDREAEPTSAKKPITVAPTLVLLSQENGFGTYVIAAAPGVDPEALRLRCTPGVIAVERLPSFGGVANFRVALSGDVRELSAPLREHVEVTARGCQPVEVSVVVEAFTSEEPRIHAA